MASREQLRAVGKMCSDFTFDKSLYNSVIAMSVGNADVKSCEICQHWDVSKQLCKIDVFDNVLTSIDQT